MRIFICFFSQFVFWLLFFVINRAVFLVYNSAQLKEIESTEIFAVFWYALRLDVSTACYIMIFPLLLLFIQSFINLNFLNKVHKLYSAFVLLLISVITASELELYREWGTKLHYKALTYLSHPSEVFQSVSIGLIILIFTVLFVQFTMGYWIYIKWFFKKMYPRRRSYFIGPLFFVVCFPLLVLGIRGGLQQIPINQSDAYFSKHNILNLAAVNSLWNIMHSIEENKDYLDYNPYEYIDREKARQIVKQLHHVPVDSTIVVLKPGRPNIVLLILEGWSADMIQALGGYKGITPNIEQLIKKGLLFSNIYASGAHSDEGLLAIFSGFPAQPTTYIISQSNKFQQLPCMIKNFTKKGYSTSLYFGGQLSYGNIKAYMMYNGFDRIVEGVDFPSNVIRGRLGVHDEFTLKRQLEDLSREQQPFFSSLFTLSSHSSYDIPMEYVFDWGGKENGYINSIYYADRCLGNYFELAKKQTWYDNTLFIIIPDHSHNSPRNWNYYSPNYRKIFMLFYGEVLKKEFRGVKNEKIASQIDLPATLLAQLKMPYDDFKWSKNLFNPTIPEFAFYSFHDGFGWIRPEGHFVYENSLKKFYKKQFSSPEAEQKQVKQGKAYLQVLFQEYLEY